MVNLNRNLTVLLHMKKYVKEITDLNLSQITSDEFKENYVLRNSVSMDIMQIGELVNHLSSDYLNETKDNINWHAIRGMRNHFAHGYFSMDFQIIYDTALYDIPKLEKFLNKELKKFNK